MNYKIQSNTKYNHTHHVMQCQLSKTAKQWVSTVYTQFGEGATQTEHIANFCRHYQITLLTAAKHAHSDTCLGWYCFATNTIWLRETEGQRALCVFLHELGHYVNRHNGYASFKNYLRKETEADAFMYHCAKDMTIEYQLQAAHLIDYSSVSRTNYDRYKAKSKRKINLTYAKKLNEWATKAKAKVLALQVRFDKSGNKTVEKWLMNAMEKASKAFDRFNAYMKPLMPQ